MEDLPLTGLSLSSHRPSPAVASVAIHSLLLASVFVLPLLLHQPLPGRADEVHAFFTEPISVAPPPPPPAAAAAPVAFQLR
jgi:hypothetical protein